MHTVYVENGKNTVQVRSIPESQSEPHTEQQSQTLDWRCTSTSGLLREARDRPLRCILKLTTATHARAVKNKHRHAGKWNIHYLKEN